MCQDDFLGVLLLGPQGEGIQKLRVIGGAAVVQHMHQFERVDVPPLAKDLRKQRRTQAVLNVQQFIQ